MARGPVRDEERARVRELHEQGYARNAIARDLGRGVATITRIADELDLPFDRAATAEATAAAVEDNRAKRTRLVARYYEQANKQLDRLDRTEHERAEVSAGQLVRFTVPELPAQDAKALLQAAGTATDKAVRLEQVDATDGAEDMARGVGGLGDLFRAAADHLDAPADDGG